MCIFTASNYQVKIQDASTSNKPVAAAVAAPRARSAVKEKIMAQ
jgi:hypothetical protein